ncbi:MAG: tRNA (adenosine(37)-N6)-threonylcarbamoyltransferase complex ATPase subunit type 1 TsaE [Solirubrobacterales bacterium]
MELLLDSVEKTMELGIKIGKLVKPGDILCLDGELGSGKTHLAKGIALGLNINEHITSPTFTIVNEYKGRVKLYHFDVYRIDDPDEIEAIGFDEYIFSDAVSIIEWSDLIQDLIPKERVNIIIKKVPGKDENFRSVSINYVGSRYDYLKEINI